MKTQPNGIRFEEAAKVLEHFGYELRRQDGSHCQYKNAGTGDLMTLAKRTPTILKCYVDEILKRIGE